MGTRIKRGVPAASLSFSKELSSRTRVNYSINCLTDSAKSPLDRIQRFWTYYIGRVLSQYAEDVKGRIFTHSINRLAKDDLESRIPQL